MLKKLDFITMNSVEELTNEVILKLIRMHKNVNIPRNKKLHDYYVGKHDILKRKFADTSKPNHRVVANFPRYITSVIGGYFLGTPVNYASEITESLMHVNIINAQNDEQSHNSELAKNMSIYGVAYELLYLDEQAEIKMAILDNNEVIPIYSTHVTPEPIAFIRTYKVKSYVDGKEDTEYVELYTDSTIKYYRNVGGSLVLDNEVQHYFKKAPIVVYENNNEEIGDYEDVINLIDLYELSLADMANDFAYANDCYLVLNGVQETDPAVFEQMKTNRLMIMPEGGSAQWLTKTVDNSTIEAYRERLRKDICLFSSTPDLSSNEFGGNVSGIALQFKFMTLEELCANKERLFKKGLNKRLQLIETILNIKGIAFNATDIETIFRRTLPVNESEVVSMIQQLYGVLSKETLLAQLPFVDDVEAELQRIEGQDDPYASNNPFGNLQE